MYQPGGQPLAAAEAPQPQEPLGASTVPVSEMPPLADLEPVSAPAPAPVADDLGLDLDISVPAALDEAAPPTPVATADTAPVEFDELPPLEAAFDEPAPAVAAPAPAPAPADEADLSLDFDLPEVVEPAPEVQAEPVALSIEPPAAPPAPAASPLEFDMSSISLDLDTPAPAAPAEAAAAVEHVDDADDPLARKLDLAEEFRQIGDIDGARELLQEVIATAQGGVKTKAQSMLDQLG